MEDTTGNNNPAYKDDNNSTQVVCIPEVFIEIEEDPVFDPELEQVLEENDRSGNYLAIPDNSGKGNSSRSSSRLSSTISIISLASTQISNRFDLEATRVGCHRCLGLGLAFLSGVLMTAYSSMIKMLVEMDSMQVVIMRGVLQMIVMLIMALYKNLHFFGDKSRTMLIFLLLVALTGGLRLIFIFTSFSRLPLGDSTAIIFSSPVLVMLFSICILKETCGVFRICAGGTLLAGVALIAKPPFIFGTGEETYDILGYSMVTMACFMSAIGIVLTKKISKKVEKTVILFYLGLAYVVCGSAGLFSAGNPSNPPLWEWGLASGISVLGVIQQYCMIYAVTLESPARVSIVRQTQIVLAYIVQIFMFDVMPMWTDVLGASLILLTVMATTFEKTITSIRLPCWPEEKIKDFDKIDDENNAVRAAVNKDLENNSDKDENT